MKVDLRLGRWEDVLADVEVDALVADPPYGERTHGGQEAGGDGSARRGELAYTHWTPDDVARFVAHWSPRTRGWMACMTSHDLIVAWESAWTLAGRYFFAPVPVVCTNPAPRIVGDGPTSGAVYLMVARPRRREFLVLPEGGPRWGSLPASYRYTRPPGEGGGGRGKPLLLLEAILRDYTEPGDLVCDPTMGWGSTLQAARVLGRRGVGAEVDPAAYAEAVRRLTLPIQPDLIAGAQ